MSLLDVLQPAPVLNAGTRAGRVHRLSNEPPARVHRIAKPEEDQDLEPPAPPRPASFPFTPGGVAPNKEGDTMPRGVYERKKKGAGEGAPGEQPGDVSKSRTRKRRARRGAARVKPARAPRASSGARFGVFDDGSVQIATAECSGRLGAEDASALVAFITRLKGG